MDTIKKEKAKFATMLKLSFKPKPEGFAHPRKKENIMLLWHVQYGRNVQFHLRFNHTKYLNSR